MKVAIIAECSIFDLHEAIICLEKQYLVFWRVAVVINMESECEDILFYQGW